jgi:hypothetical protein
MLAEGHAAPKIRRCHRGQEAFANYVKVFGPILLFGAERLPWHALPIGMMESTCVNDY